MRTWFLFCFVLMLWGSVAQAAEVFCEGRIALQPTAKARIDIKRGARQHIFDLAVYQVFLKNIDDEAFELEIYNPQSPARNYARGTLAKETDLISWARWSHDELVDVSCR